MEAKPWTSRPGMWRMRVMICGQKLTSYGKSKEEAERLMSAKIDELSLSTKPVDATTLGSYWSTAYLPTVQGHSDRWKEQIEWAKSHLKPLLPLPLAHISRPTIQALLNAKSKNLSRSSLAHIRKVLFAVLNLAEADGLISSNPVRHVKIPPKRMEPKPVLAARDVAGILGHSRRDGSAIPVMVLAGLLGLRLGEIQALKPEHFRKRGKLIVPGTKTEASFRELPLPARVRELIGDRKFPLCAQSRSSANKALKRIAPGVNPHLLRHSFATGLQELGCPVEIRERLMGHKGRGVQQIYSHGEMWAQLSFWLEKWADEVLSQELDTSWIQKAENGA